MNQFNPTVIWVCTVVSLRLQSRHAISPLQVALLRHEVDSLRRIFRFTVGSDSRNSMSRTKV